MQMSREHEMIGADLEGYTIVTELDSYPSHSIFLGENSSGNAACERVYIKLLDVGHNHSPQNILQEISSLQRLHHPHILPILSSGNYNDTTLYVLTEYMALGSL